jgi:flavin reductase (DIM6/NTAB) family NADH-FMN oxidoreductase RutF
MEMSTIRKKPWNRTNQPVYSVASMDGQYHNMNICTYVTAISMQPKRFVVGVYNGTKTLQNVQQNGHFVLQLLSSWQVNLVNRLGKQSGRKKDKLKTMQPLLNDYKGFKILHQSLAVIELKVISLTDAGDHQLALCDVVSYKNLNEGDPLTLDHLRSHGLISV